MTVIAPTAIVEEGAEIGEGSAVWDFARVRSGARVGRECTIAGGVYIDVGVRVGDRCKIQDHALLYRPAILGDGVFVGPAVVLTNDRVPRSTNQDGSIKAAVDWQPDGVTVGNGASIGAGAVVLSGVTIGPWSMVGAGAVVVRDVHAHSLVVGNPARHVAWVSKGGDRLARLAPGRWQCRKSGAIYTEDDGCLWPEGSDA